MSNKRNNKIAEIRVSYQTTGKAIERRQITNSKDVERVLRNIWSTNLELCEEFYLLLLNRRKNVLGWYLLSKGGISQTVVDVKLLFSIALKGLASSIILAHNHPSGNLRPSKEDERLTQRIKELGKLLELELLDHLIITSKGYYSFADNDML